jgi:hypothetical protein
MKVAVLLKQVPDLAEELEVDESGKALDTEYIKFRLNEYDEHALEEAVCLKEAGQAAEIVAFALDGEEVDKALFSAMAKGADKAVKLTGPEVEGSRQAAALFAETLGMDYDLIMTGVQSVDDRDGMMGPMLSSMLKVPCVSVVTRVEGKDSSVTVHTQSFSKKSCCLSAPFNFWSGKLDRFVCTFCHGGKQRFVHLFTIKRKSNNLRSLTGPLETYCLFKSMLVILVQPKFDVFRIQSLATFIDLKFLSQVRYLFQ